MFIFINVCRLANFLPMNTFFHSLPPSQLISLSLHRFTPLSRRTLHRKKKSEGIAAEALGKAQANSDLFKRKIDFPTTVVFFFLFLLLLPLLSHYACRGPYVCVCVCMCARCGCCVCVCVRDGGGAILICKLIAKFTWRLLFSGLARASQGIRIRQGSESSESNP